MAEFDSLWNYNEPKETEQKFRALLSSFEKKDGSLYLELLTQIARTLGLQQKFDQAHLLLDEVETSLSENASTPGIRYFLERGRAFNSNNQKEKATHLFEQAWKKALSVGDDNYAVDAAHMLAIAVSAPEEALSWNEKAIAVAEKSSDLKAKNWLGSLYNNTGWSYFSAQKYELAQDLFQKALAWRKERGNAESIRIAQWCVAKTLRYLGQVEKALSIQEKLLSETEKEEDKGYTYEEIGECLLLLEQKERAVNYFAHAYKWLSKDPWLKRDEKERLERLRKLGRLENS